MADYDHDGGPRPAPALRQAVIDSAGHHVAVIDTTAVQVIRLGDIGLAHALGEGEGYRSGVARPQLSQAMSLRCGRGRCDPVTATRPSQATLRQKC